jgi:hypothetical protein
VKEHYFSISGTPIAFKDKKQYLYCAIVLNTTDFGDKEMKAQKSSYCVLRVLVYKVRHSARFLTTSSAIARAKRIPNRYKLRIKENLTMYNYKSRLVF